MNGTWDVHSLASGNGELAELAQSFDSFPGGLGPVARARRANEKGKAVGATLAAPFLGGETNRREPLRLRVVGRPSLRITREIGGSTVITLRRNISNMEALSSADMEFVQTWGEAVLKHLRDLSRGPYSAARLRAMGHPYGYAESPLKGDAAFKGRKVPRRAGIGNPKGVRGAVPTMSVINSQSGNLARSWSMEWERDERGFEVRFRNSAEYGWYLAHGTTRMQAHGPWTYSPLSHLRKLDSQIQATIRRARLRQNSERIIDNMIAAAS
ncbi:hypothetical protein EON83_11065 [bacterium]|nr:MAG: hypothetical protein EON83_11065 [bacterium]